MALFSCSYDVRFARPMSAIPIFLKYKLISTIKPWFNDRLQNLVDVDALRHFAIAV